VAAIRTVQPHGPYRIMGFSFAGVLAFDVAHALLAEGEDVLLIMIDPYIAGPLPNLPQTAGWIYRRGASALKDIWAADRSAVRKVARTGKWAQRQGQRAVKKLGESLNQIKLPWEPAAVPVAPEWIWSAGRPFAASLLRAVATFKYQPFGGSVLFIQGTDRTIVEDYLNADGLNGWNGLFTGPVTRIELPERHEWMMRDPIVSQVAEILRSL
jgi:thioesterase domain-containing protein